MLLKTLIKLQMLWQNNKYHKPISSRSRTWRVARCTAEPQRSQRPFGDERQEEEEGHSNSAHLSIYSIMFI